MNPRVHKISDNAIRRLPRYLRCLDAFEKEGYSHVSSAMIGSHMNVTASQVRQDFSQFGNYGQQGYGYNIVKLRESIRKILGLERTHKVVLIGVGSLGHALMEHLPLASNGCKLLAGFDVSPERIGTSVNGVPVLDEQSFESFSEEHKPDMCILTVPAAFAANYAKRAKACGIKSLWNFTDADLDAMRSGLIIENANLMDSLFALTYYSNSK